MAKKAISNPPEKSFQNTQFGGIKIGLKRVVLSTFLKQAISKFFRSNGLDIAFFDNETHFFLFPDGFLQKRVFMKTTYSPRGPPNDFQNVKNSPESPSPHTSSKMGF